MVVLHPTDLIAFIPQYIVASIAAYYILTYTMQRMGDSAARLRQQGEASTLASSFVLHEPVIYVDEGGQRSKATGMLATPLLARPQDGGEGRGAYSRFPYSLYAPFLTIISWLGILFLLTPHRDIFIFLPHLDAAADTAISVSMGVLYFDAAVGAVVFFTGFRRRRMALLMAAVTVLFSLSLLSPSMRWVLSARPLDAVIIYITVLAMLLLITALSYQLKRRRNAFLMSYGSSVLAYVLSMAVIVYNIVSVLH